MRVMIAGLFALVVTSASAADVVEERYLCVGSKSVGFRVPAGKKEFEMTALPVEQDKYIVNTVKREVTRVGQGKPLFVDCTSVIGGLILMCSELMHSMHFNFAALRFSEADLSSTLEIEPKGTPSLTIGTCSPL